MADNMIPNLRAVRNEADAAAVRAAPIVADEAALAGKPAGQYELVGTAELVAWNGSRVTARGAMPGTLAAQQLKTKADLSGWQRGSATRAQADGSWWTWQQSGTTNGGTVISAAGGGVWVREIVGNTITARMFGAVGDGVADDTDAISRAILHLNTMPGRPTLNFEGLTYNVGAPSGLWTPIGSPRLDGRHCTFNVRPDARLVGWVGLFASKGTSFFVAQDMIINCNVPADVPDSFPVEQAALATYLQNGVYVEKSSGVTVYNVRVTNPWHHGVRIGSGVTNWAVDSCKATLRGAYLASGAIANDRGGVYASSTGYTGSDAMPGTNGFIPFMDRSKALASDTYDGRIMNCDLGNGTHGILLYNVSKTIISGNRIREFSHRGIALSPTSDYNTITSNVVSQIGSTGIHLANGSSFNAITGNTVDTILKENLEGDGIKVYVGCNNNTISGNVVNGALWNGIRVAFGSSYNTVTGNIVNMNRYGIPGSCGISVVSRTYSQTKEYADSGWSPTTGRSNQNVVTGNTISGAETAIRIGQDAMPAGAPADSAVLSEVRGTTISSNSANLCKYGISAYNRKHGTGAATSSSSYVFDNRLIDLVLTGVVDTADNTGVPAFAYFAEIRGVAQAGGGWAANAQVIQKSAGRTEWRAAGAPPASGIYPGNGDRYTDSSTGEQYLRINGAWVKVTTA